MSFPDNKTLQLSIGTKNRDELHFTLSGRIDSFTVKDVWNTCLKHQKSLNPKGLVIDVRDVSYCDSAGIALFIKLKSEQDKSGGEFQIINPSEDLNRLYKLFKDFDYHKYETSDDQKKSESLIVVIAKHSVSTLFDLRLYITFIGKILVGLLGAIQRPWEIRWKEFFISSEKFGANALLIVILVNFLVGLVIAFQSAVPLQQFGAQVYLPSLVAISYFKELGPLMTAFVSNGRSGSAFAAEIGTMKVNEELDALTTLGIDPIQFLVVPKIMAAVLMLPILTVFGILFGLLGGLIVFLSLGFSGSQFVDQISQSATYVMILSGLFKTIFFAIIIAGVGCLAGMRTKSGPSAVGDAATDAVVSGIILMIIADGIFGVIYYIIGI